MKMLATIGLFCISTQAHAVNWVCNFFPPTSEHDLVFFTEFQAEPGNRDSITEKWIDHMRKKYYPTYSRHDLDTSGASVGCYYGVTLAEEMKTRGNGEKKKVVEKWAPISGDAGTGEQSGNNLVYKFVNSQARAMSLRVYRYNLTSCSNDVLDSKTLEPNQKWSFNCSVHGVNEICFSKTMAGFEDSSDKIASTCSRAKENRETKI